MTIKKDRTSRNSISLSWQEPEHPNGIILDYEVKYYEKVGRQCERAGLYRERGSFSRTVLTLAKKSVPLLRSDRALFKADAM